MTAPTLPMAPGQDPPAASPEAEHKEKLRRLRGPDYPGGDHPESTRVAFVRRLWEEGNAEALARYWQSTRNMCYAHGRQRITWNKRQRQWEDLPRSETELPVEVNYIRPILRARTQRMMSAPIDFSVLPDSNSHDAQDRAQTAARLFEARWRLTNMRQKLDQSLELAYSSGVAAWKSFWNPALGPLTAAAVQQVRRQPMLVDGQPMTGEDGQPLTEVVYDENGVAIEDTVYVDADGQPVETRDEAFHYRLGDTDTAVRTIFHLRLNPEATGWGTGDGLRWLIDSEVVPLPVARERFPEYADRIQADQQPGQALNFERIAANSATQRPGGTAPTASAQGQGSRKQETVTLMEYWELPSEDCYPNGRLIVVVGQVVVYDDRFPQDVFPYTPIFDEPAPMTPMGRPSINDMIRPQDVINSQWSAIVAEQQMAGVGQVVAWDVPGMTDQITAGSRTIIKVPMSSRLMGRSIRDAFYRMDPAVSSPDRWRLIQEAKTTLFDVAGFHEVTRGETPPGVESGVAIERLLEQEAGQLQKAILALHESIVSWAKQQLAIARWGYGASAARWMPVNREDLGYQIESVSGADLPDPQLLIIELDNFKPHSESSRRAEVMGLFEKQLIGPRQALKALEMGTGMNAVLDSQTRHYSRARNENLAIERGEFVVVEAEVAGAEDPETGQPIPIQVLLHPGPEQIPFLLSDDDDHAIHMDVLDEIILDDTKPWEVRNAAMTHKREHRRVLMMLAQSQPQQGAA